MKSELEKMLEGELYNASDPQLTEMRFKARDLLMKYNRTSHRDAELRTELIYGLFAEVGPGFDIQAPFYCDYGTNIYAGKNLFINFNCVILDCAKVSLGDNVFLAPNVQIYTAHHPVIASERIKGPELASPITIKNNVWLGGGAIVCPGVTIGENTTIGAGSLVTRSIPPNMLAAGNPCRVLRSIPN